MQKGASKQGKSTVNQVAQVRSGDRLVTEVSRISASLSLKRSQDNGLNPKKVKRQLARNRYEIF